MRKTDVVPGTIYASHGSWGAPHPVQLLTAGLYVAGRRGGKHFRGKAGPRARPGRNNYGGDTAGYPALVPGGGPYTSTGNLSLSREEKLALMKGVNPAAELARWLAAEEPSVPGAAFDLITSLTRVNGEYEAELAAYHRNREEADRSRKDADAQRNANLVRSGAALNALKAAVARAGHPGGLRAWRADQESVVLYVEDVELITGLIVTRDPS
jgi:hypothetical protein